MRRTSRDDGGLVWAPVADAMTLVAAVFFMIFLAVLFSYKSLSDEQKGKEEKANKIAQECQKERDQYHQEQARAELILSKIGQSGNDVKLTKEGGIRLSEELMFSRNSADLLPEGRDQIRRIAVQVAQVSQIQNIRIIVEGHTDNLPFPNDKYGNWRLSSRRASSVLAELLQSSHAIPPSKVFAIGRGDSHPITGVSPSDGSNRRVEIKAEVDVTTFVRAPSGGVQ